MAGHSSQRDGEAIPRVDCCHREREIDDFLFGEKLANFFVDGIWDLVVSGERDLCERLRRLGHRVRCA